MSQAAEMVCSKPGLVKGRTDFSTFCHRTYHIVKKFCGKQQLPNYATHFFSVHILFPGKHLNPEEVLRTRAELRNVDPGLKENTVIQCPWVKSGMESEMISLNKAPIQKAQEEGHHPSMSEKMGLHLKTTKLKLHPSLLRKGDQRHSLPMQSLKTQRHSND